MRNICNLRHILCFPICDGNEVIGVAELCNKQSGAHFTKFDEEMAMAFRYLLHLTGNAVILIINVLVLYMAKNVSVIPLSKVNFA